MVICKNCFNDPEIISIIQNVGRVGDCPICGAKGVAIYDTSTDDALRGAFDNILSAYTAMSDLPEEYPKNEARLLGDVLKCDWNIFHENISSEIALQIAKELSPDIYRDFQSLFNEAVAIAEKYDLDYLKEHSILRTQKWSDFVSEIKHKNRFHSNLINTDLLKEYCLQIDEVIPVDKRRFYRGRIARNGKGYSPHEMGAPPPEKAVDGRANSAGISRLYLTDSRETTLHEIRAAEYDYVTIGTFKLQRPIKVVDLRRINAISPMSEDVDCTSLAINLEHLQKINEEMSKTMRRGDSPLDYLPTQYICDFVKSITDENDNFVFDGIIFRSAMHKRGSNLTVFDPSLFKCTFCRTYEVTKLTYHKELLI